MEGPWEISDLEFLVGMTGCFSPALFSYTSASLTSEELFPSSHGFARM